MRHYQPLPSSYNNNERILLPQDAAKQTGETALHVASYMGNAEVVRVLHEGGADVNIESEVHS